MMEIHPFQLIATISAILCGTGGLRDFFYGTKRFKICATEREREKNPRGGVLSQCQEHCSLQPGQDERGRNSSTGTSIGVRGYCRDSGLSMVSIYWLPSLSYVTTETWLQAAECACVPVCVCPKPQIASFPLLQCLTVWLWRADSGPLQRREMETKYADERICFQGQHPHSAREYSSATKHY